MILSKYSIVLPHLLVEEMNQIHQTLKFTMCHTTPDFKEEEDRCNCGTKKSVSLLDTSLSIENGKIKVDLF